MSSYSKRDWYWAFGLVAAFLLLVVIGIVAIVVALT